MLYRCWYRVWIFIKVISKYFIYTCMLLGMHFCNIFSNSVLWVYRSTKDFCILTTCSAILLTLGISNINFSVVFKMTWWNGYTYCKLRFYFYHSHLFAFYCISVFIALARTSSTGGPMCERERPCLAMMPVTKLSLSSWQMLLLQSLNES